MAKKVLVPVAEGTEEIEAVCIIDVLRRADASVTVASVDGYQVEGSHGVNLVADRLISECTGETFDLIVLPGGMPGAERLRDSKELEDILREQAYAGRLYGAICASPVVVLAHHGLLENRRATGHPDFIQGLKKDGSGESRIIVDNNCITSRGPGTALEFALKLVELLYERQKALDIAEAMVMRPEFFK